MARFPKAKAVAGSVDYMDLFGAGIVKFMEERALARVPMIGNGTVKSGIIKLAIGVGARKFLGRGLLGDSVALGFSIDGVEDLLVGVFSGMGQGQQASNW